MLTKHGRRGGMLLAAALTISTAAVAPAQAADGQAHAAEATRVDHDLRPGERLKAGDKRRSRNGRYVLTMQGDGNLVLRRKGTGQALWSSQTDGNRGAHAILQKDGNFVVYDRGRRAVFNTGTQGTSRTRLIVQSDGNVVLYGGGRAVWASERDVAMLTANQQLLSGQSRRSLNGQFVLAMQDDGNLVLRNAADQPSWSSQTAGNPGAYAVMQPNGSFAVYSRTRQVLFTTASAGDASSQVRVQDDGNLVIYSAGKAVWSSVEDIPILRAGQTLLPRQSRVSPNGQYRITMQDDGNLVFSNAAGQALWSSQTAGNPGAFAAMQPDGNLVVYSPAGQALFATGSTRGDAGSKLGVQDDGNLVIYSGNGVPLWSVRGGLVAP